jgi:hypothetical protein
MGRGSRQNAAPTPAPTTTGPVELIMPLIAFVLILGFCLLLIFGLLSVLQDLLDRNFLPDPWVTDAVPGADPRCAPANSHAAKIAADAEHSMDLSGARRG